MTSMKKVVKIEHIPVKSIILTDFGKIDYSDTYSVRIAPNDYSIDKITTDIFQSPKWVDGLMKLRDSLVKAFGLKTGKKDYPNAHNYYPVGNKLGYFTVSDRNDNEIVMAENDKHLNFRTSVMVERNSADASVYLSTIVQFNNMFGRLYFLPVQPFHRIIIKSILKKYANAH